MKNTLTLLPLILCFSLLTGYNFMNAQWSAPTGIAPSNNAAAPINVGVTTQAKSGNLAANILAATTEMRSNRYCDALGGNCFSATSSPTGGGDTITVGGQCFEPAWAVTCNWNWSGDGNDNSMYIIPYHVDPVTDGCLQSNRTYQYHTMILAECADAPVYAWTVSAYTCSAPAPAMCQTTSGTNVRTVVCEDQYGKDVDDSYCPAPKPSTTGTACTRRGTTSSSC